MAHQYKVGDKVRIKEREGESNNYPCGFIDCMSKLAGTICEIEEIKPIKSFINSQSKYINDDYHIYTIKPINSSDTRDFVWSWHSSMFEPVLEDSELTTSTSLKKGDFIPICDMIGKVKDSGYDKPEYYLDFDNIDEQEHYACCAKLRKLVPNFDKIADKFDPIWNDSILFPEFSTIDKLMQFVQAINTEYNFKQPTILKKSETYEIRFQKPKASCIRGFVPAGRAICGRRRKTAIELGHLSNTTCYC